MLSQAAQAEVNVEAKSAGMRPPRSADRDLALQLAAVRALASNLPITAAMRARGARIGELVREDRAQEQPVTVPRDTPVAQSLLRPLFRTDELEQRLAWARRLRDEAREGLVPQLERASRAGAMRRLSMPGSASAFQELRNEFPHFAEVLDFVWKRAVLAGAVDGAAFRLPPMLLDGPPGCGKTAFAERLALWSGVPIARVDMSSLNASFAITGLDAGYSTGMPGVVWDVLQGDCLSPMVLLDEIDKADALADGSSSTFLLGLLEPVSACRFKDGFVGVSIDASYVQWLATSNDLSAVGAPLRSRFRVFEVREPRGGECVQVVRSVYRALRAREPWARHFPEQLAPAVLEALLGRTAREVWQALEDACAAAVADGRRQLIVADLPTQRARSKPSIGFVPLEQGGNHRAI